MAAMKFCIVGVLLCMAPVASAHQNVAQLDTGVMLAKAEGKKKKGTGERVKFLQGEARSKKGSRTKIDFDEAAIDGNRRTPAGVAITKNDPNREYDLINLRLRWHPEMVQSAASLETGRGR